MDVPRDRFAAEAVGIIQDIAESHFVAIDLEFSGVAPHNQQRTDGKPSLQDLYEETKTAAERYQIMQIGLTVVKEDAKKGRYILHPYNFNISPLPSLPERQFKRDWTMSSGAVDFLLRHRFDFNHTLLRGVPYLSRSEEQQIRSGVRDDNVKRADMVLKAEDEALVKHIRLSINEWKDQPAASRESYLNIPTDTKGKGVPGALNRYQIRLTHQIVQNEFPGMKTYGMGNFVQITNPTAEELAERRAMVDQKLDRELSRAIGFRWILEALAGGDITKMPDEYVLAGLTTVGHAKNGSSPLQAAVTELNEKLKKRRKVLVGHNCFTDLVNLHKLFVGSLPATVVEFQDSIRELFPAVIDTKYVASFGNGRWMDTSLSTVDERLQVEPVPVVTVAPQFDRYSGNDSEHEAGFDSLLTARIAIKLSAKMETEGSYLQQPIEPAPLEHNKPRFGEQEDYVTALEVQEDSEHTSAARVSHEQHLESPETDAVDDQDLLPNAAASQVNTDTSQTSNSASAVVAIKDTKPKPMNWNSPHEVEKIRSAFASTTIYDALDSEMEAKQHSQSDNESDLLSFSESEQPAKISTKRSPKTVDTLVKEGHLMPRWDGVRGFWQVFGNKLQVNGSKEGTCQL